MRIVLQRVKRASVAVDGQVTGSIETGMLLLVGVGRDDTESAADFLAAKCANLRIFPDKNGKMNRSAVDAGGGALVVSQFTLYGNCRKGNWPSFVEAAPPEHGQQLYDYFICALSTHIARVETGVFGAMMDVDLVNDGPVTLILEK